MLCRRAESRNHAPPPVAEGEWRRPRAPLIAASFALVAFVAFVASSAWASPTGSLAETLFREGRELVDAKQYDAACEKFQESLRLDPAGGTLLNLAYCHELQGKTATAWSEFHEALAWARADNNDNRIRFALEHIARLESQLPRALITVPPAARVPELRVTLDGTELSPAAWGTRLPLDPGEHVVTAEATGRERFAETFVVSAGDERAVTIPPLPITPEQSQADAIRPIAHGSALGIGPAPAENLGEQNGERDETSTQAVVGYTSLALGAVGVGAGVFYGLSAISAKQTYGSDSQQAHDAATATNISFALGGALTAAGVLLLVFDANDRETGLGTTASIRLYPLVAPHIAAAGVSGTF